MPFTGTNLLLNNRCTIRGFTSTTNAYNEKNKSFNNLATNVPCRLMNGKGKTLTKDNTAVIIDYLLYLPFGQDIKESYQVIIENQTYEILFVDANPGNSNHHCEASLKAVKGQ